MGFHRYETVQLFCGYYSFLPVVDVQQIFLQLESYVLLMKNEKKFSQRGRKNSNENHILVRAIKLS